MRKVLIYRCFLLLCSVLLSGVSFAQSEDQLKLEADKLFYAGKYLDASPLYVRLLSMNPRSYDYNFRYGACLLYQSNRKLESLKYLRNAALNPSGLPPEFHFFFGKSLHLSYLFNDAIKEYKLYNQQRLKETPVFDADRAIQECENGKRLMTTITDIIVTDKKEISNDKFFRIYDLSNIGGSLLVTAEFQSKIDKKNNHVPLIHFPANPTVIYYSSYGDRGENGKDIYVRRKLPDNSWGQPQALPGEVNTPFDEDFPYMHPDGDYLYFSSKGHNTMGGFDVFRAKYDKETNTFGKPENMDFAISSPDDDVFYVVDSLNKDAVFASSRQSQEGFLHVYKVKVDRVPIQMAVVKGQFFSSIDTTIKKIDFTIRDYSNGDFIGKFNSNDKGSYLITFPKGGKYEFVMTVNDASDEYRSIVSIPFMKEFKPLKQQIQHVNENGIVSVKIVNQFDQPVEDPASVLAEVVQKRGELNVNVQEFDMAKIEAQKATNSVLKDLGMEKLNMIEVSYNLQDQIKKGLDNKASAEKLNSNINNLIVENSADFLRLEEDIKQKVAASSNALEPDQKYKLLKEAQLLMGEQNDLKNYSADLSRLRDSINRVMSGSTSVRDIDKLKQLSSEFDKLVSQGNQEEALNLLSSNRILVQGILKDTTSDLMGNLVDQAVGYDNQIVFLNGRVDAFNRDIKELDIQIQTLNNSLYSAKAKEAEEIKSKIASKEEEKMLIQEERDLVQKSIDKLRQEKFVITEQMELLKDAISNKSLVVVSEERSKEAVKQTEKTNTNTLISFVDQQVADIEKKDPAIKNRVVVVNNLSAQNIYQEYKSSDQGIKDDSNLNAEDRLYKQLSNERKALRMINKRLDDLTKLEKTSGLSSDQQAERQQLMSYQNELTALVQQHELDIRKVVNADLVAKNDQKNGNAAKSGNGQATSVAKTYTAQEMISQADPGYASRKDAVTKDPKLNEQQKLEALNREDQRMLSAVNAELTQVETKLTANPTDVSLKNQRDALLQAKTNTEQAIASRDTQIAQAEPAKNNSTKPSNSEPQSKITATTQTELVGQLDPEYQNRTEKINSNQGMTQEQKASYLNAQDTKLISSVDAELKKVQADLAVNPTDKRSLDKQLLLNDLKQSAQRSIDERNAALTDQIARTEGERESETESERERPSTDLKSQGTGDNTNKQQVGDQIARNEGERESETERERSSTDLKNQGTSTENKNVAGNQNGQQSGQNTNKQEVGDQIARTERESETETESPSTELRAQENDTKFNGQDSSTENKNVAGNQNGEQGGQNTNKQQVGDQIARTEGERETESERGTESDRVTERTSETLINKVAPTYTSDLEKISANSSYSETERLIRTQQVEKDLLSSINVRLSELNKEIARKPQDESLKSEKASLQGLKDEAETRSDEREQLIASKVRSEMSDEQFEKQLESTLAKTDPQYTAQLAESRKEGIESVSERKKELGIEENLTSKLLQQKELLNKQLEKQPTDKTLLQQQQVLAQLIKENETRKTELKEDIAKLEKGQPLITVSKNDLSEELSALDPEYIAKKDQLKSSNLTEEERTEKLLEQERDLSLVLNARKDLVSNELKAQTADKELKKELKVLEQLIAENEREIRTLEGNSVSTPVTLTAAEGQRLTDKVDAGHKSEIASINTRKDLTEEQKLDALQTADEKLLSKVYDRMEQIDAAQSSDGNKPELAEERRQLSALSKSVEARIDQRGSELDTKLAANASTEFAKKTELNSIDASFEARKSQLESNATLTDEVKKEMLRSEIVKLQDKVTLAINAAEKQLEEKGSLEDRKRLITLKAISADLENELKGATEPLALQSEQQEKLINEIDRSYQTEIELIKQNSSLSEFRKQELLKNKEERLLAAVKQENSLITKQLLSDPGNKQLQLRQQQLNQLEQSIEDQIAQQKAILSSPEAKQREVAKNQEVTSLQKDYLSKKTELQNSKMEESAKVAEQMKLENNMLAKLESEQTKVQRALEKSPNDQVLKKRVQLLNELVEDQKMTIGQLENRQSVIASNADRTKILSSGDAKQVGDQIARTETETETETERSSTANKAQGTETENKTATGNQNGQPGGQNTNKQQVDDQVAINKTEREREQSSTANKSQGAETDNKTANGNQNGQQGGQNTNKQQVGDQVTENKIKAETETETETETERSSTANKVQGTETENKTATGNQNGQPGGQNTNKQQNSDQVANSKTETEAERAGASIANKSQGAETDNKTANGNQNGQQGGQNTNKQQVGDQVTENKIKAETETERSSTANKVQGTETENKTGTGNQNEQQDIDQKTYVSNLRSEQLKENASAVQATYTTKSELEAQDRQLEQYENFLTKAIEQQEGKVAASPEDTQAKSELNLLKNELESVQYKRRSVKISLGELEKLEVVAERSSERAVDSPELKTLDQQEAQLNSKLEQTDLTKKERKQTEAELTSVKQQQQKVEGQLLTSELRKEASSGQDLAKQVANNSGQTEVTTLTNKIATLQKESDDAEIAQLNKKASETKDPQEKNYLLTEALKKQEASNDRLKEAAVESQLEVIQKESGASSLETVQELETKKRRYTIQIGELTKLIEDLDAKIASTKPKAAGDLIAERKAKVEEQEAIKRQLALVEQKITTQQNAAVRPETIAKNAGEQQVSYQEEREIASSEQYKRYVEKVIPALELEKQIATLEAQLQDIRSESRALTAKAVNEPSQENTLKAQQNAQIVAQLEKQLAASKQELVAKQQLANEELPANGTEAMKWQNLLKRGVEPVQRAAIIAALVPMPANGLEINKNAVAVNSAKPIPVDVKSPTGLVYRVQVGAFSKPIPQDRFREFNPVSGETLNNGITRYMAGYFNNSTTVTDARDKIRAIGYKDAFAIAYCDGKRISIAEARALEASGQCVPKGENELIMEMATNTAVNLGITVADTVLPALPEVDYTMVPGGVKSEPVEKHPGLFYTVQVGVFNNPVNAKVVNIMQPLMSNRLPNGQIRYSSGMFATVDEARPKKQEAIDKGIKDAFITAYYKSQRITLAEAEQLLAQNGTSILEANRVIEAKKDIVSTPIKSEDPNSIQTTPKSEVKIDPKLIIPDVKVEEKVQIVTKKTFDEFPREILNRYNSHGSFYYDEQDKRVKSAIANSREELPQVYYFKDDIDTVVVMKPTVIYGKTVRIDFTGSSIPGDFTDWLLRYNYRREFKRSEGTTILRVFAIPEEQLDILKGKLDEFGLTGTVE